MPKKHFSLGHNETPIVLALASILLYLFFAYHLVRTDAVKLIVLYSLLFFVFYQLVKRLKNQLKQLAWLAFAFRAVFIIAIPNLSQDFYRFIWDGRMVLEGFNPYLQNVASFINAHKFPVHQAQTLYEGMGVLNASHFTNYPPLNQVCFAIAALFSGKSILGSVVVMRVLIIAADFGTLYFGKKLLTRLNLPSYTIFWYILNPFIIIELTGNLHFEGLMIYFLVWSLYLLHMGKWKFAAVVLGLSISVKLIPLLFLPLFYQWFMNGRKIQNVLKPSIAVEDIASAEKLTDMLLPTPRKVWIKSIRHLTVFYVIIGITISLLFAPFYSDLFLSNYATTTALWFQNFEFNASLFNVAKSIGYLFRGRNEIIMIGKFIPIVVFLFVLVVALFRKNHSTLSLISSMVLALSIYFFTATTIHPWYVATLLMLSIFTTYKFPLVWSFVVVLSYLAYLNPDNTENLWIIGLEYTIVYSVFIWELFINKKAMKTTS